MTPDEVMTAIRDALQWGYSLGLAFGVFVLVLSSRGGE